MRRDVLVVLAVVVTASILFAPCALDDVSSAKEEPDPLPVTTFTVYGYISNISDHDKNVPLGDVSVSLLNKDESLIEETVTSEDGRFEFTYDLNDCDPGYIFFDLPGYTPRALPDSMEFTDDANTVSFDISEITPDEDGKYPLSGDCYSGKAVGMAITNGKLFGTVYGINGNNTFEVEGSTVTAISANGVRYTASTNSGILRDDRPLWDVRHLGDMQRVPELGDDPCLHVGSVRHHHHHAGERVRDRVPRGHRCSPCPPWRSAWPSSPSHWS